MGCTRMLQFPHVCLAIEQLGISKDFSRYAQPAIVRGHINVVLQRLDLPAMSLEQNAVVGAYLAESRLGQPVCRAKIRARGLWSRSVRLLGTRLRGAARAVRHPARLDQ